MSQFISKKEKTPSILSDFNKGIDEIELLRKNKNIQNFTYSKATNLGSANIGKYVFQFRSLNNNNQKGISICLMTINSKSPILAISKEEYFNVLKSEIGEVVDKLFEGRKLSTQLIEKLEKGDLNNFNKDTHDFSLILDLQEYDEVSFSFKTINFYSYSVDILFRSAK